MGLVRKLSVDSVAAGQGDDVDMATRIRQAVTDEIERRRVESALAEKDAKDNGDA